MFAVRTIGILFFALAAGCGGEKEAPRIGPKQDGAVAAKQTQSKAKEATVALAPPPAGLSQPVTTGDAAIRIEPVAGASAPPPGTQDAAEAVSPTAEAPAQVSASQGPIEQPRKIEDPPSVAKKQEPPLDVAALKTRLRDTNAIGVFTKLALKNQMDDLLKQFRAYHQSGQKTSVTSLRQPYDMLVLKVLSVVQDGDPSLARTISGSREAIWGILADREKFNSLT